MVGRKVPRLSILVVIVQWLGAQRFALVLDDRSRSIAAIGCVNPRCSCGSV